MIHLKWQLNKKKGQGREKKGVLGRVFLFEDRKVSKAQEIRDWGCPEMCAVVVIVASGFVLFCCLGKKKIHVNSFVG